MAKLGDFFTIASGGTPDKRNPSYYENGTIPWVKTGDLKNQYVPAGIECITEEGLNNSSAKLFPPNTVLVAMYGATIGACSILSYEAATNQACAAFLPNENVLPTYLYYFLSSKRDQFVKDGVGGAQPNISAGYLKNVQFGLIPMQQQIDIVEKLDKVEKLIALRKEQLAKLDELVKSRFVELFGDPVVNPKSWETAPLSALIINANNGMARRGKDADGSIVLRLVELQNGFIDYSAPNRICLNETEKKRYELIDNDFLFARVNGNPDYVGRCAVFKSIAEPVFHNDHIIRVHFDEAKINGCFMSVLLNSDYGKRQMRKQIKTSAGQYTISQDGIGAIMAILPPMELQNQFAAFVEQTDKSKVVIQESLRIAEYLFDSLMQKYFGE